MVFGNQGGDNGGSNWGDATDQADWAPGQEEKDGAVQQAWSDLPEMPDAPAEPSPPPPAGKSRPPPVKGECIGHSAMRVYREGGGVALNNVSTVCSDWGVILLVPRSARL